MFENQNGSNLVMPVSPMGNNEGNGLIWWIVILFFLMWGGNGAWGNGNQNGMNGLYPWMNQSQQVNDGFRDQMMQNTMSDLRSDVNNGFSGVQQSICGLGSTVQNGFAQAEISNNARQMADMQQNFGLQSGIADLKYVVATENCADRNQASMNTRDIIDAINTRGQAIENKLCQLELDGVKNQLAQAQRENVGLQNQLNMANLAASQTAQNATIRDSIIGELRSCPIPCQPVFGNQPIFTCRQNQNPGCPCGNSFAN